MTENAQCNCGKVQFRITSEPINVRFCHCRMCQKATGAPFLARALFHSEDVKLSRTPSRYPSSDRQYRIFCKECGTHLGATSKDENFIALALAIFDDRNAYAPTEHIWVNEKVNWITLVDGLPQYAEAGP